MKGSLLLLAIRVSAVLAGSLDTEATWLEDDFLSDVDGNDYRQDDHGVPSP